MKAPREVFEGGLRKLARQIVPEAERQQPLHLAGRRRSQADEADPAGRESLLADDRRRPGPAAADAVIGHPEIVAAGLALEGAGDAPRREGEHGGLAVQGEDDHGVEKIVDEVALESFAALEAADDRAVQPALTQDRPQRAPAPVALAQREGGARLGSAAGAVSPGDDWEMGRLIAGPPSMRGRTSTSVGGPAAVVGAGPAGGEPPRRAGARPWATRPGGRVHSFSGCPAASAVSSRRQSWRIMIRPRSPRPRRSADRSTIRPWPTWATSSCSRTRSVCSGSTSRSRQRAGQDLLGERPVCDWSMRCAPRFAARAVARQRLAAQREAVEAELDVALVVDRHPPEQRLLPADLRVGRQGVHVEEVRHPELVDAGLAVRAGRRVGYAPGALLGLQRLAVADALEGGQVVVVDEAHVAHVERVLEILEVVAAPRCRNRPRARRRAARTRGSAGTAARRASLARRGRRRSGPGTPGRIAARSRTLAGSSASSAGISTHWPARRTSSRGRSSAGSRPPPSRSKLRAAVGAAGRDDVRRAVLAAIEREVLAHDADRLGVAGRQVGGVVDRLPEAAQVAAGQVPGPVAAQAAATSTPPRSRALVVATRLLPPGLRRLPRAAPARRSCPNANRKAPRECKDPRHARSPPTTLSDRFGFGALNSADGSPRERRTEQSFRVIARKMTKKAPAARSCALSRMRMPGV